MNKALTNKCAVYNIVSQDKYGNVQDYRGKTVDLYRRLKTHKMTKYADKKIISIRYLDIDWLSQCSKQELLSVIESIVIEGQSTLNSLNKRAEHNYWVELDKNGNSKCKNKNISNRSDRGSFGERKTRIVQDPREKAFYPQIEINIFDAIYMMEQSLKKTDYEIDLETWPREDSRIEYDFSSKLYIDAKFFEMMKENLATLTTENERYYLEFGIPVVTEQGTTPVMVFVFNLTYLDPYHLDSLNNIVSLLDKSNQV